MYTMDSRTFPAVLLVCVVLSPVMAFGELTEAEQSVLSRLDTARVIADLQRLSEGVIKTRSGAGAGTAVAGSPEEKALADTISQEMKKIGLTVRQETYPVRRYDYGEVSLTAGGKSIRAISLHAAGGTWGTRDGVAYARGNENSGHTLRVQLADAGEGYAPDYTRAGNVRGKAVLVRRGQPWPVYQILEAAHQGAAAILMYDFPQAPDDAIKQDSMWYHEQIPMVSISKADAKSLQQQSKAGLVEIALENRIDSGDGLSQNVIGTIAGSEFPDEWVIVSAHYDRWWVAAQDNCSGVATMLELARALSGAGKPRRSLMFLATGGEEAGVEASEQDWLAGSDAFVKAHPEITRRLVYDFNIDLAGWTANKGNLETTPDLVPQQQRILADLLLSDRITAQPRIGNTTDAWNFGIVGGGAASILHWNSVFGESQAGNQPNPFTQYYHTQLDVFHPDDYKNLPVHLRLGALSTLRMDRTLNVPIQFSAVASWVGQALTADAAKTTGVSFDDARVALQEFQTQSDRVEKAQSGITSAAQARPLNRWLMRTRKNLLPWLYGQNSNLRTSGYATMAAALSAASEAADKGDRSAAVAALDRVNTVRMSAQVSPEVARDERLYWYSNGDWSSAYYQKQRPVGEGINAVYRRLKSGGAVQSEAPALRQFADEARGYLSESLFIVAGKLREATEGLREAPLP
ncbi:MAG: M28 family peptidase [Bryobacteraceae bacterium]|jgi:Zn-dependent M28 family amino/carboxypeptidase